MNIYQECLYTLSKLFLEYISLCLGSIVKRVFPEQLPSYSGSEISGWTTKWVSLNVSISTALDLVLF